MSFQRSNEPIVWALFGGGGVVAAFLLPALILVTGIMAPLGVLDGEALSYTRVLAFSQHWLGKLCWFMVITLPMWHAMHRIYHGLHDLKVGARNVVFVLSYGLAMVITIVTATLLLVV
jgi:fumarate reductase subunit D